MASYTACCAHRQTRCRSAQWGARVGCRESPSCCGAAGVRQPARPCNCWSYRPRHPSPHPISYTSCPVACVCCRLAAGARRTWATWTCPHWRLPTCAPLSPAPARTPCASLPRLQQASRCFSPPAHTPTAALCASSCSSRCRHSPPSRTSHPRACGPSTSPPPACPHTRPKSAQCWSQRRAAWRLQRAATTRTCLSSPTPAAAPAWPLTRPYLALPASQRCCWCCPRRALTGWTLRPQARLPCLQAAPPPLPRLS
mmetsp:Transcript_10265/g.25798  ORF Transcript_10265/g.25798 Transcript_10265/m.25798 type:complete len:255 (-) Transcript_10265:808-1572(-)